MEVGSWGGWARRRGTEIGRSCRWCWETEPTRRCDTHTHTHTHHSTLLHTVRSLPLQQARRTAPHAHDETKTGGDAGRATRRGPGGGADVRCSRSGVCVRGCAWGCGVSDGGGRIGTCGAVAGRGKGTERKLYEKFWVFINGFILQKNMGFNTRRRAAYVGRQRPARVATSITHCMAPALPSAALELPTSFTTGRR